MTPRQSLRRWRAVLLAVACLGVASWASAAWASEALGDLDLYARVLQIVPARGAAAATSGVAKVELLLQAAYDTSGIDLRVTSPDGRTWRVKSGPFSLGRIPWTRPDGGEPYESGDGSTTIASRGTLRAVIDVPLEGAAIHEMVFQVSGVGPSGPIRTTAVVRAPLGVPNRLPVDDGEIASFPMEVRP